MSQKNEHQRDRIIPHVVLAWRNDPVKGEQFSLSVATDANLAADQFDSLERLFEADPYGRPWTLMLFNGHPREYRSLKRHSEGNGKSDCQSGIGYEQIMRLLDGCIDILNEGRKGALGKEDREPDTDAEDLSSSDMP